MFLLQNKKVKYLLEIIKRDYNKLILLHFARKFPNAVILCEGELITLCRSFPGARVPSNLWKPRQLRNCWARRKADKWVSRLPGQGASWVSHSRASKPGPCTATLTGSHAHGHADAQWDPFNHGQVSSRGLLRGVWCHRRLSFSQIRKFRKRTVSCNVFLSS